MQITGKYLTSVYAGTASGSGFTVGNYLFVPHTSTISSVTGLTLVWSNEALEHNHLYIYKINNSSISVTGNNWTGGFEVVKP